MHSYKGKIIKALVDQGHLLAASVGDLTPMQREFLVMAEEVRQVEAMKVEALKKL